MDASAGGLVFFNEFIIARKLALGSTDTTLDLRRALVNQVHSLAQTLRSVTILFHLEQLIEGSLALCGGAQEICCERALRNADGGAKERFHVCARLDAKQFA